MSDQNLKIFYGTFGQNQTLRNSYVKFLAADIGEAHQRMHECYTGMYAFVYVEDDFERAILRWHLIEVPMGTPNARRDTERGISEPQLAALVNKHFYTKNNRSLEEDYREFANDIVAIVKGEPCSL